MYPKVYNSSKCYKRFFYFFRGKCYKRLKSDNCDIYCIIVSMCACTRTLHNREYVCMRAHAFVCRTFAYCVILEWLVVVPPMFVFVLSNIWMLCRGNMLYHPQQMLLIEITKWNIYSFKKNETYMPSIDWQHFTL